MRKVLGFVLLTGCSTLAYADEVKPPVYPPVSYTVTLTVDEANLLMQVFLTAEMAQTKWGPLAANIQKQIGTQNDIAKDAFTKSEAAKAKK